MTELETTHHLKSLLDGPHQPIEMVAQCLQAARVEQQPALTRGGARGARRCSAATAPSAPPLERYLLMLPQQDDLIPGKAERGIRDRLKSSHRPGRDSRVMARGMFHMHGARIMISTAVVESRGPGTSGWDRSCCRRARPSARTALSVVLPMDKSRGRSSSSSSPSLPSLPLSLSCARPEAAEEGSATLHRVAFGRLWLLRWVYGLQLEESVNLGRESVPADTDQ